MTSSYNARFKKQAMLNLCLHVAFFVLNHHKQLHARGLCHRWAFGSLRVVVETYTQTKKKQTYGKHQMPRNTFGYISLHNITYLHSQLSNARLNVVQDLGQQFQTQLLVSHECMHSYLLANSKRQRHAMGICSIWYLWKGGLLNDRFPQHQGMGEAHKHPTKQAVWSCSL